MDIIGPVAFYFVMFMIYWNFVVKRRENETSFKYRKQIKKSVIAIVIVYTIIELIAIFG
jgi:hypothetical protein